MITRSKCNCKSTIHWSLDIVDCMDIWTELDVERPEKLPKDLGDNKHTNHNHSVYETPRKPPSDMP